jgi:hypothetical protein
MTRVCSFCGGALRWASGHEQSARERAGNARETDVFVCDGCQREYQHSVSERFDGNAEGWYVRDSGAKGWTLLADDRWPTFRR